LSSVSQPFARNTGGVPTLTPRFFRWLEILLLLALPVLTFWFFNMRPVHQASSLDPYFYTGYINNAEDMLKRFGLPYYAVRFGLIVPGRFFNWAFGAEPGYFVFRYVLSLVSGIPLYFLARRKFSHHVGLLAYCALILSPWFARTLLWDHPDASGVPYLMAAMCLVLLGRTPSWWRDGLAGCCVSLAVNSNVFTGAIFGIFGACYVALSLLYGTGWRTLLARMPTFTAGFALVLAGGYAYYWHVFGEPRNIFKPTFEMTHLLSSGGMKNYRLTGYQWLLERYYVLVPVLIALSCLAVCVRRRLQFEAVVCVASGTAVIGFYFVHQFLMAGDTLQLFYYTSYALPTTFLMLVCIWQSLWESFTGNELVFLAASVTATLIPLLLISAGVPAFEHLTASEWTKLAAATLIGLALARYSWRSRSLRSTLVLASLMLLAASMAAALGSNYTYRTARPFSVRDHTESDTYRVALQLIAEAPKLSDGPGRLIFWYSNRAGSPINSIQSTFLWGDSKINQYSPAGVGMPILGPYQMLQLRNHDIRYLVLLGETKPEIQAGLEAITRAKVGYDLLSTRDLHSGDLHVYWQLIELTTRPPDPLEVAPK
jgi:hypothetical protein